MGKLLMVSLDAMSDADFARLAVLPHTAQFIRDAALVTGVMSTFITNTYPVHTSIITGQLPDAHGIISNYTDYLDAGPACDPFLHDRTSRWSYDCRKIRVRTLWQAAKQSGLTTAAVMWPVTGYSREIDWNIPEAMTEPGKSQLLTSLRAGSKAVQLIEFLRHRKHLRGAAQPGLDMFATRCALDILRRHRPDLTLLHLTAFDSLCHQYGKNYDKLAPAFQTMDEHLGMLLRATPQDTTVLLLADHAQLDVRETVDLTAWARRVCLSATSEPLPPFGFEHAGGSAFFHPGGLSKRRIEALYEALLGEPHVNRALTAREMLTSGHAHCPFGVCARPGYAYGDHHEPGNHGYPSDYEGYQVFYAARGPGTCGGARLIGGSLLDIAPLAARILGVAMQDFTGRIMPGIMKTEG